MRANPEGMNIAITRQYNLFLSSVTTLEESFVITFERQVIHQPENYLEILLVAKKVIRTIKHFVHQNNWNNQPKVIRKVREANHPSQLSGFAQKLARLYAPTNSVLIGLEYGGIELPFLVNAYRVLLGKQRLRYLTISVSNYSEVNVSKSVELSDLVAPYLQEQELPSKPTLYVLDDAVTTGRTLDQVVKMFDKHSRKIYFAAVSFTNTNRYHHLTRANHGGVNPWIIENSTFAYPSNYTQTYSRKSYKNRHGVFDRQKNRIYHLLSANYSVLKNL